MTTAPVDVRVPVPYAQALSAAGKAAADVYGDDLSRAKTPTVLVTLSDKLMYAAAEERSDAAARYVLLTMARDVAARSADLRRATAAADELSRRFDLDPVKLWVETAKLTAKSVRSPDQRSQFVRDACLLAIRCTAADRFDAARAVVAMASEVARAARETGLRKEAALATRRVNDAESEWSARFKGH